MQNLIEYLQYHKKIIIISGVYLVVLVSIPLSFMMVQSSQIFRSQASEVKTPPAKTQIATSSAVPKSSPLEDLKKLTESLPKDSTSSSSDTTSATTFGPTLKFKLTFEGHPTNNQAASKVFVGIASGSPTTKPTYLLTFSVDVPASGIYSGLSLAGLTTGSSYTAYIKGPGQIDKAIAFTMGANETNLNSGLAIDLISGDVNEDNTITSADQTVVSSLYGTNSKSSNWNPNADFNLDGVVNNFDLSYVTKNLGKIGDSGVWVSPPPTVTPTPTGGASGNVQGATTEGMWIWVPNHHLYKP